jgi:hypothetical protein
VDRSSALSFVLMQLGRLRYEVQWNGYVQLSITVLMESLLLCGVCSQGLAAATV